MKVVVFGATGMVGQGALRELTLDAGVERVLSVGRTPLEHKADKVTDLVHKDLFDLEPVAEKLAGYDACFFCLGTSAAGMDEAAYRRITYDLTLSAAETLCRVSPGMTFLYVSGAGTDSSEKGRTMWARVKGATENALLALPFEAAYMLRPGFIQPVHGVVSKTRLYRAIYAVSSPLFPLIRGLAAKHVMTSETLGQAMLVLAREGAEKKILEAADLNEVAARYRRP